MKKITVLILTVFVMMAILVSCGGISDVVSGGLVTTPRDESTLGATEAVTDPVRDGYYEEIEEVRVFENVTVEIDYDGNTYVITDEDTASTILFAVTSIQMRETEADENVMTVRIYRGESVDYEVSYPFISVPDESGKEKVYRAYINGFSADIVILDLLEVDGYLD